MKSSEEIRQDLIDYRACKAEALSLYEQAMRLQAEAAARDKRAAEIEQEYGPLRKNFTVDGVLFRCYKSMHGACYIDIITPEAV